MDVSGSNRWRLVRDFQRAGARHARLHKASTAGTLRTREQASGVEASQLIGTETACSPDTVNLRIHQGDCIDGSNAGMARMRPCTMWAFSCVRHASAGECGTSPEVHRSIPAARSRRRVRPEPRQARSGTDERGCRRTLSVLAVPRYDPRHVASPRIA